MSDRDELANALSSDSNWQQNPDDYGWVFAPQVAADSLWAAGWRKKPSAAELVLVLVETNGLSYGERAEAVLALMDGPTETGER